MEASELVIELRKAQWREWLVPLAVVGGGAEPGGRAAPAAAATGAPAARAPAVTAYPPPVAARGGGVAQGTGTSLGRQYAEWDSFDQGAALTQLANENLPEEPGLRLRSGGGEGGAVGIEYTDYKKDKEEVALDEDLADGRGKLQQTRTLARTPDPSPSPGPNPDRSLSRSLRLPLSRQAAADLPHAPRPGHPSQGAGQRAPRRGGAARGARGIPLRRGRAAAAARERRAAALGQAARGGAAAAARPAQQRRAGVPRARAVGGGGAVRGRGARGGAGQRQGALPPCDGACLGRRRDPRGAGEGGP